QQEQSFSVAQTTTKSFSDQSPSEQQSFEQMKDLRSEMMSTNGLHQSAGQSHGEFKLQMQTANAATAPAIETTPEDNEANIREIMNQAQYLVKKGGGEVNVKMTPEGMGDIQL